MDYYTFTTTARYQLTFGVWRYGPHGNDRIHSGVALEDAEGNTIAESSPPPADSTRETLETAIGPGTYYVRVEAIVDGLYSYFILFGLAEAVSNTAPNFDTSTYSFSIAEDAAAGAAVGTVSATDADNDTLTYTITAGNSDAKFAISTSTGAITTAGTLDYETDSSYTLTVQADDDNGGTDTATVNVTVARERTEAMTSFRSPWWKFPAYIQLGLHHMIEDDDDTTVDYILDARINDADGNRVQACEFQGYGSISITSVPAPKKNGGTANILHELRASYSDCPNGQYVVAVMLQDENGNELVGLTVAFRVGDNSPPEFGSSSYGFSVAEDAAVGDDVGTVTATDADNDSLFYIITSSDASGKLAIDLRTGAITVSGSLDHETDASYTLTVQADDGDGGSATTTVNVAVADVDGNTVPSFDTSTYSLSVAEDAVTGTVVGTVSATDADDDTLTYTIESGNGDGKFAISHQHRSAITVAGALDYEADFLLRR